jgi:alkaline phosphatase D
MWDNHEFSWQGWQSILKAGEFERPAQSVKVAANQAWFEYIPVRVAVPGGSLERFDPPAVNDVAIEKYDDDGIGDEPNNRIAINSLIAYRALRYGRHLELIITDQHSFHGPDPFSNPELDKLGGDEFLGMFPEDVMEVLDGGRTLNGGRPPDELAFGEAKIPNFQKGCAAAVDPWRQAEAVVQGQAQAVDRDLESVGQFAGRARPGEPIRRICRPG